MIRLLPLLVILLVTPSLEQGNVVVLPRSPCPNVFMYEPTSTEPGKWYGVVNLSTDSTLHSLWLNIVLDSKADILGNWIGDVSTSDNLDFKIENTKMKIEPGPATAVRFFIQYNPLGKTPKLQTIRLNGREICNALTPVPVNGRPEIETATRPETSTYTTSRTQTRPRPIEVVTQPRPVVTDTATKPVRGRPSGEGPVYVPTQSTLATDANPYSIGGGQNSLQNVDSQNKNNGFGAQSSSFGTQTNDDVYGAQTGNKAFGQSGTSSNTNFGSSNQQSYVSRPTTQDYYTLTTTSRPTYHRPSVTDNNDYDSKPDPDDYFTGPRPVIPVLKPDYDNNRGSSSRSQCGKVVKNNPNPLVVNGKPTLEGQWPWQIALYQARGVDSKYICGGTLVSNKHVITAAHCVTLKGSSRIVNKNTLTIYLGKHNLRTSIEGVQIKFVEQISVHPQYNASSFVRDASILTLLEPVQFTDWVRPACLWPEEQVDLSYIIGKRGSVVGWGFDETGLATEELSLVEMPVVDQETCIRSFSEFFARFTSEYTYCAGARDGANSRGESIESSSVCNGDSGGGMVFNIQNTWYLRGLVSLSVAKNADRCDPNHYVVFTDLAKMLPWIRSVMSLS